MTRSGSGCSLSPRAAAVIAGLLAGCGGLLLERVGDDGAGDGHGCVPPWRIDGDHADDGADAACAVTMLADLRQAAWLAAAAKVTGSGNWLSSRATGPAKMLFVTTACFETYNGVRPAACSPGPPRVGVRHGDPGTPRLPLAAKNRER